MPNLDEIAKAFAIIGTVVAGVLGVNKWLEDRRKKQRIRQLPSGDFPFEVIKPRSPDLLKQIIGGDENNALADYKIPYQERQPNRNVRQELETAFTEKNWVLILGKSGLGKTREAAHLAEVLNQEGWTVLKLVDKVGEWLDVPKQFPNEISPNDKLLFFLDNLNRWMYPGNPHEIHPKAGEELARPLREPVQERLPRLLQYFEQQGKAPYVRVIATARNEREPDTVGDTSPWGKLQWEKYKSFWDTFYSYPLEEASEIAVVSLLTDCVAAAEMKSIPEEYGQIARRNDGTFRNITLNLESAKNRGLAVNYQNFLPKLDQTWRYLYSKVVQLYPLARHAYDAVELLRTLNLWLTAPLLVATTRRLLPGRGVRRWRQEWQLRRTVLPYLITTVKILKPEDGQIEAKKTGAVDVGRYVPAILQQLSQMAKQDPTYPAASECFDCGNSLYSLGYKEEAIASYDKALEIKPDLYEVFYNKGFVLFDLERKEEAIASYDKALEIKPDYYAALHNRGVALSALERKEEAIVSYDKALECKPNSYGAWNNRGVALSDLGRKDEAVESYDKALKIQPNLHEAWSNQGNALSDLGQTKKAIASYDKALEMKPDLYDVWCRKGLALSNLGQNEEALSSFDQALHLKPDLHDAWYARGVMLGNLSRTEEAIASYDKALEIKPDKYEAWGNRGTVLTELGRYEEALVSYNRVLKIKPDDNYAIFNKAACYSLQKEIQKAIETLQYAITLDFKYRDMAKTDSDFDAIRDDARFQVLIGE